MPLRAKIDETKLPKMAAQQTNGEKPKTGIKVIIIGAGLSIHQVRPQTPF
jgi:hypothetical protein